MYDTKSGVTLSYIEFKGDQISYQKGLMTSRPKEEGHFTGKHVTSAVAASQWQNLKIFSLREGRAEVEQSNEAMTLI